MIPGPVFRALFETEAAIRNMTVQAFSTIVFRLMAELEGIHSYKLRAAARQLPASARVGGRHRPMTQQDIASHLGTTREVVGTRARSTGGGQTHPGPAGAGCRWISAQAGESVKRPGTQ